MKNFFNRFMEDYKFNMSMFHWKVKIFCKRAAYNLQNDKKSKYNPIKIII